MVQPLFFCWGLNSRPQTPPPEALPLDAIFPLRWLSRSRALSNHRKRKCFRVITVSEFFSESTGRVLKNRGRLEQISLDFKGDSAIFIVSESMNCRNPTESHSRLRLFQKNISKTPAKKPTMPQNGAKCRHSALLGAPKLRSEGGRNPHWYELH